MMLYCIALNPFWTDGAVGVGEVTLALVVVVAVVMDVVLPHSVLFRGPRQSSKFFGWLVVELV